MVGDVSEAPARQRVRLPAADGQGGRRPPRRPPGLLLRRLRSRDPERRGLLRHRPRSSGCSALSPWTSTTNSPTSIPPATGRYASQPSASNR